MPLIEALRRLCTLSACALAFVALPALPASTPAPATLVAIGQPLPNVVMSGLNGPQRPLTAFRGRPLIINVWASWCGPCRGEAASLERLAWGAAGSRYAVIGISTDDDRMAALQWLKSSNATISHYIDHQLVLENLLGAQTIPLTVLVDPQGRVVARFRGARQWDTPEAIALLDRSFAGAVPGAGKR